MTLSPIALSLYSLSSFIPLSIYTTILHPFTLQSFTPPPIIPLPPALFPSIHLPLDTPHPTPTLQTGNTSPTGQCTPGYRCISGSGSSTPIDHVTGELCPTGRFADTFYLLIFNRLFLYFFL